MITGFAFRSPEVVRFLINITKYNVCVVPDTSKPNVFDEAIAAFLKKPNTGRKRVYLHKSVAGMLSCFKKSRLDPATDLHLVFDALSILSAKPCVRIIDIETRDDANWQLKRTMPAQLNKILESIPCGVDAGDLQCLGARIVLPEEMIDTDRRVGDLEKQVKNKSFLHVIQDIQSKNADKRDAIAFWICALYAGVLLDRKHAVISILVKSKWTENSEISIEAYKEKVDTGARDRMISAMQAGLLGYGFEMKKTTANKIQALIGSSEHIVIMRALFLMQELNYSAEKAAYSTGANISAVALISRSLWDRSQHAQHSILARKHEKQLSKLSIPRKCVKTVIGKSNVSESERLEFKVLNKSEDKPVAIVSIPARKRNTIAGKPIPAGLYSLTDLAVQANLVSGSKTPIQILATSKSPITTTAQKFIKSGKTVFKITSGKTEYLRFQGTKIKLLGT